jgi:hypothetical protein
MSHIQKKTPPPPKKKATQALFVKLNKENGPNQEAPQCCWEIK